MMDVRPTGAVRANVHVAADIHKIEDPAVDRASSTAEI